MGQSHSPSKEELRALLEESYRRTEQEIQRAEIEKQRAEIEKQRAETLRQHADEVEERYQKTTFAEYLQACHQFISKPISIQTDNKSTTKGSITNPTGRICPTYLQAWDFRSAQQSLFDEVYEIFHSPPGSPRRVFSNVPYIEGIGKEACDKPLASENDLRRHQETEVENRVKEVVGQLVQLPAAQSDLKLGQGIFFENHTNTITEEPGQVEPAAKQSLSTDQNCVYMENDNDRRLLYIIEYKAAHKLPDAFLRAGLQSMNILKEVVHKVEISTDPEERLLERSMFLSCAAITQTFDYMIKGGLEYGCLTNGRMKVMLRVPEDDPSTLHYCLLEPSRDAEPYTNDGLGFRFPYTAVGCQLGLTLLACQSGQRSQPWRNDAMKWLHRWDIDFETMLKSIPRDDRHRSPRDSSYRGPKYPINPRSPYLIRQLRSKPKDTDSTWFYHRDSSPDPSGDSDTGQAHLSPSPSQQRTKRQRKSGPQRHTSNKSGQSSGQKRAPNPDYCTQACLRGLSLQSDLDSKCPNMSSHRKHSSDGRHPLSRLDLVKLVSKQLNKDPAHCCRPLGEGGLHGSIFAITLDMYGYTFIGKGTEYNSLYEGNIYQILQHLQGSAVPVYLGDIYLRDNVYFLDPFRVIIHMSLMAWAGKDLEGERYWNLGAEIQRTQIEVQEAGIEHLDVRCENLLWNEEVKRVMLIDFGRANILRKRKDPDLSNISPNPKRRASKRIDQNRTSSMD